MRGDYCIVWVRVYRVQIKSFLWLNFDRLPSFVENSAHIPISVAEYPEEYL
jgi:hypothetical protein